MAQTNLSKIKKIEKEYNCSLNFYYLDTYGYYCDVIYNIKPKITINIFDAEVISKSERKFYVNDFINNTIYQYL